MGCLSDLIGAPRPAKTRSISFAGLSLFLHSPTTTMPEQGQRRSEPEQGVRMRSIYNCGFDLTDSF